MALDNLISAIFADNELVCIGIVYRIKNISDTLGHYANQQSLSKMLSENFMNLKNYEYEKNNRNRKNAYRKQRYGLYY
jgi:hypothetical protein